MSSLAQAPLTPPWTPIHWPGLNRKYEFQLDHIGTPYLARPGVYIFCKQGSDGNWYAVYVGETDSFARRLYEELSWHHCWDRIRAAGATHISTLHVPGDRAIRLTIETDLRQSLRPTVNSQ